MCGTAMSNNGINVATLNFSGAAIPQYPNNRCGAPGAAGTSPSCPAPTGGSSNPPIIFAFDPNYKQPMVQQWSLAIERELFPHLSPHLSYLAVPPTHSPATAPAP